MKKQSWKTCSEFWVKGNVCFSHNIWKNDFIHLTYNTTLTTHLLARSSPNYIKFPTDRKIYNIIHNRTFPTKHVNCSSTFGQLWLLFNYRTRGPYQMMLCTPEYVSFHDGVQKCLTVTISITAEIKAVNLHEALSNY